MATITGFTADRMLVIENETVTTGQVQGDNLILSQRGGAQINAGNVRGPKGDTGPQGTPGVNGTNGVIINVNDVSAASVYSPRTFPNQAAIASTWPNAPIGSLAISIAEKTVWEKDDIGWFARNDVRLFASTTERDSRWPTAPDGSICQAPAGTEFRKISGVWQTWPKYPTWPKEGFARSYSVTGGGTPSSPLKFLSGRAQITTDAAGRTTLPMGPIYTECGVSPIPVNIFSFFAVGVGVQLNLGNDTGYPWGDVNNIPIRAFTVTGTAYQGTFNIMFVLFFQNGAA